MPNTAASEPLAGKRTTMPIRNKAAALLILASFGLLVPGVTLPVFNLGVDVQVASNIANINAHVLNETRSILGTVADLLKRERFLVGSLILIFSIVVPVLKGIALLIAIFARQ